MKEWKEYHMVDLHQIVKMYLFYYENHTKLFIRALNNKSNKIIYIPKYEKKGIDFNNLKNFMVICNKKNTKDMIEIYYTQT